MSSRYNFDMTVKKYLSQIAGKTAALFGMSCYLGAKLTGAEEKVCRHARRIGYNVGMAFQIIDDILDYRDDAKTIKKPTLEDMKQGVYTLPLIIAMNSGDREAFIPYLSEQEDMSERSVINVLELVHHFKGIEQAENLADKYTNKALSCINKLPDSDAKDQLLRLTVDLLTRID